MFSKYKNNTPGGYDTNSREPSYILPHSSSNMEGNTNIDTASSMSSTTTEEAESFRKEYQYICESIWPLVQSKIPKGKCNNLLCGILMISYEHADRKIGEVVGNSVMYLEDPLGDNNLRRFHQDWQQKFKEMTPSHKTRIRKLITDAMAQKKLGILNDVDVLTSALQERKYIQNAKDFKSSPEIKDFLDTAADYMCRIILHEPPIKMSTPKVMKKWSKEGDSFATLLQGSNPDKRDACIKYYTKPVLYCGSEVLEKGIVFVDGWNDD